MSPPGTVRIGVRFASLLQRYAGVLSEEIEVPRDPASALAHIIERYSLPWVEELKKTTGVFINRIPSARFIR